MKTNTPHICPPWVGKLLVSPLRKMFQNPDALLKPYIKPGMKVVDYGCAMGFFTLPMARLVGESGDVWAIDVQKKMIDSLYGRMAKAKLEEIIHPLLITENTNFDELTGKIDFVLLFAMVHEVPDQTELFHAVSAMLKPGGKVLLAEPKGHVNAIDFENTIDIAVKAGLNVLSDLRVSGSHGAVLVKG